MEHTAATPSSDLSSTTPTEIVESNGNESPRSSTSSPAVVSAHPPLQSLSAVTAIVPTTSYARPPIVLDALIGIILALALALFFKRIV